MSETEDQIVSDHSRALRGLSATSMRLLEIIQRRKEESRRREADGQREAAQALRDREVAQRDAARTLAAQGLDPRWREAASDREIATAFVYAEAYAETDPLARVAHDQMEQHLAERHESVAQFVDANISGADLERVPAPEGTPTATQQRWIDAARASDATERHEEQLSRQEAGAAPDATVETPRVLDAQELQQWSDQTIASLVGDEPSTIIITADALEGAGKPRSTVLDPDVTRRWADETVASVVGGTTDTLVIVPDLTEMEQRQRIREHLATVGDDVAAQWADISQQYGRDRADQWLEGGLTPTEMGETNKWLLWNEAQQSIAEGVSIEQAMQELAEREDELGLNLDAVFASELAEEQGEAATALERGDMEHAGVGQFPHERNMDDLAERDPDAARVLQTTRPGRTQSAAEQVGAAATKNTAEQRKARKHVQERGPERSLGR